MREMLCKRCVCVCARERAGRGKGMSTGGFRKKFASPETSGQRRVDQLWEKVFPPPPYPPPRGTAQEAQKQAQDKTPGYPEIVECLERFAHFLGGWGRFGPLPRVVASAPEGGPKKAPRWPQDIPRWPQDGPTWP